MLNIKVDVKGLDDLEKRIAMINELYQLKDNKKFQEHLKAWCLSIVKKVTNERLTGGTSNDDLIEEYKLRNKVRDTKNGFILYNDTILPATMFNLAHPENYPNGFSVAMAFEYGTGIVGANHPKANAWEYNVHDRQFAWWYTDYGVSKSTEGYEGFEIYRFAAEEIKKTLPDLVHEFYLIEMHLKGVI